MKAENVMVFVGAVLIVAGLLLSLPNLKLQVSGTGCLQYVPSFPSKLKEGEVIYAWTGPSDGQTWDGFVFVDRTNEWIQVRVELWNGSVVKSKWIPPTQKVWDFKELKIKMPSQPAFLGVEMYYSKGQPQTDADFNNFGGSFGVWISLDGAWKYPLDYSGYHFKVYGVAFANNLLTVDIDFTPRSPDIGSHSLYAFNKTASETWKREGRLVKIADLQAGRHVYTATVADVEYVKVQVYGLALTIPKSQFGSAQTPPQQPPTEEQPSNENPPEYPALQPNPTLPAGFPAALMVTGAALTVYGLWKRKR